MASGDSLLHVVADDCRSPESGGAAAEERNDRSIQAFEGSSDQETYIDLFMPQHYDGGGIDVVIQWMAASATTGVVRISVALERQQDDVDDGDVDSFGSDTTISASPPSAAGEYGYDTVSLASGSAMDNVAKGEGFRVRLKRPAGADAADTMTGDWQFYKLEIREQ